jgi:hypothetical protein
MPRLLTKRSECIGKSPLFRSKMATENMLQFNQKNVEFLNVKPFPCTHGTRYGQSLSLQTSFFGPYLSQPN